MTGSSCGPVKKDWFNHYIFGDPLPASGTGAW